MPYEYINKEFYQTINKADRRFLNVDNQDNAALLITKLKDANISFSATLGSRNTITLSGNDDLDRAKAFYNEILNTRSAAKTIIGNTAYKYLPDKKYIRTDAETAKELNRMFAGDNNIKFSGVVQGNNATITVSGNKDIDIIKRLISNIKNRDLFEDIANAGFTRLPDDENGFIVYQNNTTGEVCGFDGADMLRDMFNDIYNEFFHRTEYRIELTTDAFDDMYYISAADSITGEEKDSYYDDNNFMPTFEKLDEAIEYCNEHNIIFKNAEQFDEWRSYEEEKNNNIIAAANKELISKFPTQNGLYPDHISYNEADNSFVWTYFNNDGDNGNGEFVEKNISEQDIYAAYMERTNTDNEADGRNAFIDYIFEHCNESVIDTHSEAFKSYAESYINKPETIAEYYGIGVDSSNVEDMNAFIKLLTENCPAINKEPLNIESMEELSYAEQLYTRVNDEYSYFIGQMKKESAEVLIKSAAEIADKDKIRLYFEEFEPTLSDEQYEALLVRDNPLNEIYEQWVKNGELNSIEDVSIALKEAADRILVSVEREKAKEKKYEPVPEEMMYIILDDMPSFVKSSVAWDELMEYGGIAERISNGEDPVAVVKSYIAGKGGFSYSPNKLTAKFGRSFYCTWSAKDNGDTAVINVSVTNLNNGDRYQSQRTFAWSDIADYFKKRIEQEENYNKLSDGEIIVSVIAGTDNYRFIDNGNGIDAVKNREELIELFSEMFNKSELNAIIRNYIDEAPTEEYEIPKPINKEHINISEHLDEVLKYEYTDKLESEAYFIDTPAELLEEINGEAAEKNYLFTLAESEERTSDERKKASEETINVIWNAIPESIDEETGKPTSWAAEINSDAYGRFIWISQNENNSYDVEYDTGERIIPVSSESVGFSSLSAAKEWAEEFYSLDEAKNNKRQALIVNIYGGPGAGKSTTALQLAAELKKRGYNAEYVSEVAKDYVYGKRFDILDGSLAHQKQIFAEQKHRVDLMIGNVDIAITDAPLTLNTIYLNPNEKTPEYKNYILSEYNRYNNYNIYIERDLSAKFEQKGRIHNFAESIEKDTEIKSMLIDNNIPFDVCRRDNIAEIADKVSAKIEQHEPQKQKSSTYEIYQIPSGARYRDIRFMRYEQLELMGQLPDRFNYEKVYSGDLDDIKAENKLDGLFVKFNYNRPDDFKGHSLSVSDVIVINNENGSSAHYVDDIGYKDITDVFLELNSIRQSDRTNETININDYDHIRLVSRSEWNDNTLSDNENPAFEEITKSYDAEDGYYTKYAYNKTNSHLVDIWEEENTVSGEDLLEDIADHLKKMASGRANTSHYIELSNDDGELYRKIENNHFTFVREENDSTQKNSPLGNSKPIKKKSGSEIEVGDRFLYNDREYTITSENGIYPNDVGATREEKTGGISYTVSQNIDRYKLAENGVFLGNSEKASEKNEQMQEISSDTIITQQDIDILRTLPPRKSVLNFTDEEKAVTVNWAERFKNDIAEKSPFYRAENGDWRADDNSSVPIRSITNHNVTNKSVKEDIKSNSIFRGIITNSDTDWNIQVSRKGLEDTYMYAVRYNDTVSLNAMYHIDGIIKNSVLLDTTISEHNNNNKSPDTLLMHKMYALVKFENEVYIAKLTVEELFNGNTENPDTLKRLYNLQDIKIEPLRHLSLTDEQLHLSVLNGSDISVSDLFKVVKSCDKDFYTNSPEHSNLSQAMENSPLGNLETGKENNILPDGIPMPDATLTIADMEAYGYKYDEAMPMLPISKEKAYEMSKEQFLYNLYSDNTSRDTKSVDEHTGIFGINQNVWEHYYLTHSNAYTELMDNLINDDEIKSNRDIFTEKYTKYAENSNEKWFSDYQKKEKNKYPDSYNKLVDAAFNNYMSDIQKRETSKFPIGESAIEKHNFHITDDNLGINGAKTRYAANVAAIKTLKAIESENRYATPDEQEVLSKYTGWGAIPQAFNESNIQWDDENRELKSILTDEEYKSARASTLNAHFTSPVVIKAVYSGLANLGFGGGKILEPAMGTGNFFGVMPESMLENSRLYGVELDSLTGRIAKQLYQNANISITGFEKKNFADNSFDVAVGNVPFGSYKLSDSKYNSENFFIHDYFFAKSLDKVKPGGIVAFITSKGTLDKANPDVRRYLSERAELLGAIRLPNNAFKANSGTEVTSDIIFLKKRDEIAYNLKNEPDWIHVGQTSDGVPINKYFETHPEMILGKMKQGVEFSLYGNPNETACVPIDGENLENQLAEAVKNITGYISTEKPFEEIVDTTLVEASKDIEINHYGISDNKIYYRINEDSMRLIDYKNSKDMQRTKSLIELKETVNTLLSLELNNNNNINSDQIGEIRAELNYRYNVFVSKYGRIADRKNKKAFDGDSSYHLLRSLELSDSGGDYAGKADIFFKNTVKPKTVVEHVGNSHDALILSVSEKAKVDFDYMENLTGKSKDTLISDLENEIYQIPESDEWVTADEYLSGNIRKKLEAAKASGMEKNIAALEASMPPYIDAADIDVELGASWIPPKYIKQFVIELLSPPYSRKAELDVKYSEYTDKWNIENIKGRNGNNKFFNANEEEIYGMPEINAYEIIEISLNLKFPQIKKPLLDENGNTKLDQKGNVIKIVDKEKTAIALSKQKEIKSKFRDWIFNEPERRDYLTKLYNDKFNSIRLREYNGSNLNFAGMNPEIELKDHQKDAVARQLYGGNTLLAHEVGAGKTYEMVAAAMEGKRLGLHSKALIAVPNSLTEQWGNDFRKLYPNANILVASEKDLEGSKRKDFLAQIATGEYDAIIMSHSAFDRVRLSPEREVRYIKEELETLRSALAEAAANSEGKKKSFSVKQIELSIKSKEKILNDTLARIGKDDVIPFEKLGVDKLFIDESHAYKNLDISTKMTRVAGIGGKGSNRSLGLLMKCKYLNEKTDYKGITFASGTPIITSYSLKIPKFTVGEKHISDGFFYQKQK